MPFFCLCPLELAESTSRKTFSLYLHDKVQPTNNFTSQLQPYLSTRFNGLLFVELGNVLDLSQVKNPHSDLDISPVEELGNGDAEVVSKEFALPGSAGDAVGQRLGYLLDQEDAKLGQRKSCRSDHLEILDCKKQEIFEAVRIKQYFLRQGELEP